MVSLIKFKQKERAIALRKKGFSFREISESLDISKSTASLWLKNIILSFNAKKRIENLGVIGRKKADKTNRRKRLAENKEIAKRVRKYFKQSSFLKKHLKIACALLYWCEGSKHKQNSSVSFMNADPKMIKYFLYTFRNSFNINEKKLRGLVHLHEYHNVKKQVRFWSKIASIPVSQFNKSYLKKNTGKNKKENYPGCLSIRYCNSKIYRELMFTIEALTKNIMRG